MHTYQDSARSARHWIDTHRPLVGVVIALALAGTVLVSTWTARPDSSDESTDIVIKHTDDHPDVPEQGDTAHNGAAAAEHTITVHVVGCVANPGVYSLTAPARVIDAIEAAGGLGAEAAGERINLAQELVDGVQVRIPSQADVAKDPPVMEYGVIGVGGSLQGTVVPGSGSGNVPLVDINTADAALLESLPGIGPSTSAKIIAERTVNGPFASLVDLARVPGIGQKKIAALEGLAEAR